MTDIKELKDKLFYNRENAWESKEDEQLQDVFAYAVLNLLFSSGIRVSELVNLKLKNFKIEEKLLMVTGKGIKDRYVPLRDEAIYAINDYLKKVRNLIPRPLIDKEILFLNKNGRKYNNSTGMGLYLCKKLCLKLGLGISIKSKLGVGTEVTIVFPINNYNLAED